MLESLSYQNESDRAYGLAGMTVTACALGAEDLITSICIDNADAMVTFSHSYYYGGSPSVSPKASRAHMLRSFHVTAAMIVANVYVRSHIRLKSALSPAILASLREAIADEGKESCGLEQDEADDIFNRSLRYSSRLYDNPRLEPAIREFADVISRRRRLSHIEIDETLRSLGIDF